MHIWKLAFLISFYLLKLGIKRKTANDNDINIINNIDEPEVSHMNHP